MVTTSNQLFQHFIKSNNIWKMMTSSLSQIAVMKVVEIKSYDIKTLEKILS